MTLKKQQNFIKEDIDRRVATVLEHGRYINGPEVREIENLLADYCGTDYAIACGNGTDALQISLMSLETNLGDEIITTPFTFIATVEVILLLKLTPVFVDIDPETYNIDPHKISEKITSKTRAILSVSLYGQPSDMDAINKIASQNNLIVIEDAAQSFGATYKGKKSCGLSDMAITSFFPSKPLGCYGDGGMIFTSNKKLANQCRIIANHGQKERYQHIRVGLNSRLDSIQAAILLSKMSLFEEELKLRQEKGAFYTDKLKDIVKTPTIKNDRTSVYAQYTILAHHRKSFCKMLLEQSIPTAIHYPIPVHKQPLFNNSSIITPSFPIAEEISKKVVSLPMHPYLEEKDQRRIIESVKKASM